MLAHTWQSSRRLPRLPRLRRRLLRLATPGGQDPAPTGRNPPGSEDPVLVVGGGLAGLGAALAAARAGLRVRLVDAAPQRPGEPRTGAAGAQSGDEVVLPLEYGQKGIWSEYPNIVDLLDTLAPGGSEAVLTRPTRSGFYSGRGLEVNSPIFGRLPRLPAPLGTLAYTSPLFQRVPLQARLSALPLVPSLLDALAVGLEDEDTKGLDDISAAELFQNAGVDADLYEAFLKPVLQALLFRPPQELSAFVTLRVLWCYVFKRQESFDVRWARGPLDELLLRPLVQEVERLGGSVEAGRRLADIEVDGKGQAAAVVLEGGPAPERVPVRAVVLAAGVAGTARTLESCGAAVQERLGPLLTGLQRIGATECTAVRFALDRPCPTRFSSNVLSGMQGLEETGATFFMLERLQNKFLRNYAAGIKGGERLRGCPVVAMDFYGSDRGPLASMCEREVVDYALSLLREADPESFQRANLTPGVRTSVLRGRNAATHFAPGSRRHRPTQCTDVPNLFFAGDYVKGLDHGAEGLSQERALVSGYAAANLAMDFLEEAGAYGLRRQYVRDLSPDEPQVELMRKLWKGLP